VPVVAVRQRLKKALKRMLERYERRLLHVPAGALTGVDMAEDLRLVVGRDAPLCLDVGANRGQTIDAFRRIFTAPVIHAFEPASEMFRMLEDRAFGPGVFLHHMALGREPGEREFTNYQSKYLSSFLPLERHPQNRFRAVEVESKEIVRIGTVDAFLKEHGLTRVDLLKIDVQGFDLEVLLGASDALSTGVVQNVLVELNFVPMYEGQAQAPDIIEFLRSHGLFLTDHYEKKRQGHTIAWSTALFSRRDSLIAALPRRSSSAPARTG
jgi:FkbM family methyltransferase